MYKYGEILRDAGDSELSTVAFEKAKALKASIVTFIVRCDDESPESYDELICSWFR
jgi:hypothetical protein